MTEFPSSKIELRYVPLGEAKKAKQGSRVEYRRATPEELAVVKDLTNKGVSDVLTALKTTMVLAGETAGPAGIWVVSQRAMGAMLIGAAMSLYTMRTALPPPSTEVEAKAAGKDDLLYCALLAYVAESSPEKGADYMTRAREMFKQITGRDFDIPEEWEHLRKAQA